MKSAIHEKSFAFAIDIIRLSQHLIKEKEFVLSRQIMRSGTSVGANIRESKNAESKKDFIHKLSISQKECDETIYWLELLYRTDYINESLHLDLRNKALELLRILTSILISTKKNMNQ